MNENGNDTSGQTPGQAIVRLFEGGLPRLLLSKPVQQAIGRLIFAAADVPIAKLQQWAENIRSDTFAQKQVATAIAREAKAVASDDPALIDRGLERWTRQLGKRQMARENIAARTLISLYETGVPPQAESPSEEFMGLFEDVAEKASSEELADLFARILAGEIRKPKSVSRRTLQTAAILDAEIVGALNTLRPYLFASNWAHIPPSKADEWHNLIALLSSVSITTERGPRVLAKRGQSRSFLVFGKEALVVDCLAALNVWLVDGVNLTPIGTELVSVLPASNEIRIEDIGQGLGEHAQFILKVRIGTLSEDGTTVDMNSLRDFPTSSAT